MVTYILQSYVEIAHIRDVVISASSYESADQSSNLDPGIQWPAQPAAAFFPFGLVDIWVPSERNYGNSNQTLALYSGVASSNPL